MRIPQLTHAESQLLQKIGMGAGVQNDDSTLSLTYQPRGDIEDTTGAGDASIHARTYPAGLLLSTTVEGHPLRLWFNQDQWCRWVEPVLAVPDWQSISTELHETLATWTCCTIAAGCDEHGLAWPETGTIEAAPAPAVSKWHLSVTQDERRLDMDIVDAPLTWLHELADCLTPLDALDMPSVASRVQLPVPLVAGWSRLRADQLTQLHEGAALVLHHTYQVGDGECGLFINPSCATLRSTDNGTFIIEDILENFDDWLDLGSPEPEKNPLDTDSDHEADIPDTDTAPSPKNTVVHNLAKDALLTVTAEVATLEVPLHQLANLQVGDVLPGPMRVNDRVTLKVGARAFAQGTLLDIDGRLAVRVENLL